MELTKRCPICQVFFKPLTANGKYCPKCRGKKKYYVLNPVRYIHCKQCGVEIETRRKTQKYCSDTCRYTSHGKKKLAEKKCALCDKSFYTTKNYQKYCTKSCRDIANRQRAHENYRKEKRTWDK